jgi:hypothetical protein
LRRLLILAAVYVPTACFGQAVTPTQTAPAAPTAGDAHVDFLMALAQRESGGDKASVNGPGYLGLFQMGGRALVDAQFYMLGPSNRENAWDGTFTQRARFADVVSKETYLEHAGAQELAVRKFHEVVWTRIVRLRLDARVGTTIAGITLTRSGMLAGSHLVGVGGLLRFVRSNGTDNVRDGNNTPISEYLSTFAGYY